ncbi:PEP-CTERM sorting domain-containing protein [Rhizobacter sp. Root1221]|nr:PEP-CTERM sorting domain-containing protein [Rhizobacter sp. Root1221]
MSAPVPEPETWLLLLAGAGIVGFTARKRQQPAFGRS